MSGMEGMSLRRGRRQKEKARERDRDGAEETAAANPNQPPAFSWCATAILRGCTQSSLPLAAHEKWQQALLLSQQATAASTAATPQ